VCDSPKYPKDRAFHDSPFIQLKVFAPAMHRRICLLGFADRVGCCLASYRDEPDNLALPENRGCRHVNPEVVAVLPAAFGHACPGLVSFDCPKEVLEYLTGCFPIGQDALRRAKHFVLGVSADLDKIPIDVGNLALEISF
jgi:hypothetical protein